MVASEREPVMAVEQYLKMLGANPYGVQTFGGAPEQMYTTNTLPGYPIEGPPGGGYPGPPTGPQNPPYQGSPGDDVVTPPPGQPAPIPPPSPGTPPPGGGPVVPGMNLSDLIKYLQGGVTPPSLPGGTSDELAKAYLAYAGQTGNTALQQAVQIQLQQQQNALRQAELMGADPNGAPTDAAARWRAELEAQQGVQGERLRQEYSQLLGFATDANGNSLGIETLEARNAAAERALREQLQGSQLQHQAYENEAERRLRETLQGREQQWQSGESAAERQLRMALQSGQLNQQESEFARSYLLKQDEGRRQQAALSGFLDTGQMTAEERARRAQEALQAGGLTGTYNGQQTEEQRAAMAREALALGQATGNINGQQTEEQRAAMERERQARASTAADLTKSSRDVFRAANYFRNMQGGGGLAGALGLGGGVSGFTTQAQRDQGTPGTIGYGDIDVATGDAGGMGGGFSMASPSTLQAVSAPGAAASGQGGASPGTSAGAANATAWADSSDDRKKREQGVAAGTEPGGPVGMGAGGSFLGRQVSPEQDAKRVQAMRDALGHPKVKKMFRQMRDHMTDQRPGTEPGGPQGRVPKGRRNSFDGTLERDRRANRGLVATQRKLERRMMAGLPGMQPGGPVDAPMWPAGGSGSLETPSVPKATSVGGTPPGAQTMMAAPATPAAPFAQADVPQMDQKLASFQEYLRRFGVQGLGAQSLEAMNSTDKGIMEGAFEALGLNPEDAYQAYAQTRFANTGNALMA